MLRFALCPIFSLVAGLLRLITTMFGGALMRGWLVSPELPAAQASDFPPEAMMRIAEPFFWPNLWRSSLARGIAWLDAYDGPSSQECSQLMHSLGPRHLDIRAETLLGQIEVLTCFDCLWEPSEPLSYG